MALDDEVKKYNKIEQGLTPTIREFNEIRFRNSISDTLNGDVGQITSRDQILDPYSVVDPSEYRQNRRGRAAYQSDLAQAKRLAEQQEAAYQEWYNSPAQVAARERAAGRNPDLAEPIGGEAADTAPAQGSPVDGIPTNGEVAISSISAISSIIGTIGSLAALPSTIGASIAAAGASKAAADLAKSQKDAIDIANTTAVEKSWFGAISDRLADSFSAVTTGESFDFDAWFADESNFEGIFESYVPSGVTKDDPRYGAAWNRVKKNIQRAKQGAYSLSSDNLRSEDTIAQLLANPYRDNDVLIAACFYEPIMARRAETEKILADYEYTLAKLRNPEYEASAINAEYKYKTNYFQNVASEEDAARILQIQLSNQITGAKSDVISNYRRVYNDKSIAPLERYNAASIIMGAERFSARELGVLLGFDAADEIEIPNDTFIDRLKQRIRDLETGAFTTDGVFNEEAYEDVYGKSLYK